MSTARVIDNDPQLEDILIDEEIPLNQEKPFAVDSIEKAVWVAKKYLEAQSRIDKRNEQNMSFKDKIDKWSEKASKDDISTLSFMKSILKPFLEKSLINQKKGSRSVKLPEAVIGFRKTPSTLKVDNEEIALSFCEANHPECLEIKKSLKKTDLKKLLDNGELIPGLSLQNGSEVMYIKEA